MFMVLVLKKDISIDLLGFKKELELSWSDGMVGAVPVFEKIQDAERYAKGTISRIIEVEFKL